jgi:hypothetical protein
MYRPSQTEVLRDGVAANARLTGAAAAALLVLLAAEGATIPFIGPLLGPHIFIGLLLIPPVALKMGSTGYRFLRYYSHSPAYVRKGPPHAALRFLAPGVVLTTLALFGTGVALLLDGPPSNRPGTSRLASQRPPGGAPGRGRCASDGAVGIDTGRGSDRVYLHLQRGWLALRWTRESA